MPSITAELRGAGLFGKRGHIRYLNLHANQPLVLRRQPHNPVDSAAIVCLTTLGLAVCYVEREIAAIVAPQMDAGIFWRACVVRACTHRRSKVTHYAVARLWCEESDMLFDFTKMLKKEKS